MLGAQGCPPPSMIFINITNWPNTVFEPNTVVGWRQPHDVSQTGRSGISGMKLGASPSFTSEIHNFQLHPLDLNPTLETNPKMILPWPAAGKDLSAHGKPD